MKTFFQSLLAFGTGWTLVTFISLVRFVLIYKDSFEHGDMYDYLAALTDLIVAGVFFLGGIAFILIAGFWYLALVRKETHD